MMPNFLFTSVDCPDAKWCQLVMTLARTLRSYLDSCHSFTVLCNTASGASVPPLRLIPCPTLIFAPCQLVTAGRTPPALPESQHRLQMQRVTRWAPHPDGTPHSLAWPSAASRTGASHTSLHSAETLGLASQLALPPPRFPTWHQRLICCPGRTKPTGHAGPGTN